MKYYSGTVAYETTWTAPADTRRAGGRVFLGLGDVRELANIYVNKHAVATLWKTPYRADITNGLLPAAMQ